MKFFTAIFRLFSFERRRQTQINATMGSATSVSDVESRMREIERDNSGKYC